MNPAVALLRSRATAVRTAVRRAGWAQLLIAALYVAVGLALAVGAYFFFSRAFVFMLDGGDVAGPVIVRYVLEVAFAFTFFLGVASFVAAGHSLLWRAEDLNLLVPMPVPSGTLFGHRFLGATLLASWPVVLLAAPALAALGSAQGGGAAFAAFGVCVTVLFALAIAVTGALASFLEAWLMRRVPTVVRTLIEAVAFIALGAMLVKKAVPRGVFALFEAANPIEAAQSADRIAAIFGSLPSHPFAVAAAALVPYEGRVPAWAMILATAAALAVAAALLASVASRLYVPLWQEYRESGFIAGPHDATRRFGSTTCFPRVFRAGHSFLFEKDALTLLRDGEAASRGGFLLLLLVLQLLTVRAITFAEWFRRDDLFALAVTFAFVAIGYFALTFALRFAYPSFAQEGRGAWLLWSSPIHGHEIFSWKFFFWGTAIGIPMTAASVVTVLLFALPWMLAATFVAASLLATVALVALALAIGALLPDWRGKDPDYASTSPGGIATTVIGGLYLWIIARYVQRATATYLAAGVIDPLVLVGITVVSIAVTATSWAIAVRMTEKMEVA